MSRAGFARPEVSISEGLDGSKGSETGSDAVERGKELSARVGGSVEVYFQLGWLAAVSSLVSLCK